VWHGHIKNASAKCLVLDTLPFGAKLRQRSDQLVRQPTPKPSNPTMSIKRIARGSHDKEPFASKLGVFFEVLFNINPVSRTRIIPVDKQQQFRWHRRLQNQTVWKGKI
jgi:hypothetical protein